MIDPMAERWRRLTVKEGWRQFVTDEPTERPERLDAGEYRRMDERSRKAYDVQRLRHAYGFGPIRSLYADVHRTLSRLVELNELRGPGARHGAALDGNPGNGKSTIVSQFGRHYERRCRERYPHELTPDGHEYLPVLYVNVDALPTIKGLNEAMLTFYGIGPPRRANARQLTQLVLECARCCQTSLIVIDDIHLLELRREADRDANNHLKRLANDLQATFCLFVYAGSGSPAAVSCTRGCTALTRRSRRSASGSSGCRSNRFVAPLKASGGCGSACSRCSSASWCCLRAGLVISALTRITCGGERKG